MVNDPDKSWIILSDSEGSRYKLCLDCKGISHFVRNDNSLKTMDPRHAERVKTVQSLYAACFTPSGLDNLPKHDKIVEIILKNVKKVDEIIAKHAPKYPLDRIAKTDLSILRLAVYELIIEPQEPSKVVINEAVELAKEIGSERSYAFINAVLGSIHEEFKKE